MSAALLNAVLACAKAREIRAGHVADRDGRCVACDAVWPCQVVVALDEVLAVAR